MTKLGMIIYGKTGMWHWARGKFNYIQYIDRSYVKWKTVGRALSTPMQGRIMTGAGAQALSSSHARYMLDRMNY